MSAAAQRAASDSPVPCCEAPGITDEPGSRTNPGCARRAGVEDEEIVIAAAMASTPAAERGPDICRP
jgi:hypothetical protein